MEPGLAHRAEEDQDVRENPWIPVPIWQPILKLPTTEVRTKETKAKEGRLALGMAFAAAISVSFRTAL